MEKFSKWRDPGTGIQPFLPAKATNPPNILYTLLQTYILGPPLFIVKTVLCSLLILVNIVGHGLSWLLLLPVLKRVLGRFFDAVCFRLVLGVLGVWWIESGVVSLKKSRRTQDASRFSPTVQSGDIIISNHLSYLDIFYYLFRYSPVFVQVYAHDSSLVEQVSWFKMISQMTSLPDLSRVDVNRRNRVPLSEVVALAKRNRWGPVVVFPEGTTSNGKALLKFSDVIDSSSTLVSVMEKSKLHLHVVGLRYEFSNVSPTYTVGSLFGHVYSLCTQFSVSMQAKMLHRSETPGFGSGSGSSSSTFASSTQQDRISAASLFGSNNTSLSTDNADLSTQLMNALSQMMRLRRVSLGVVEKRAFLEYWMEKRSGNHQQTSSIGRGRRMVR